jgi:uncharacterized protein (TIGR03085 family)
VRERRPDAGLGIVWPAFAAHTERVRLDEAAEPYAEIVERVRSGPSRWSPMHLEPIDALANSVEFFVHHEDVRRAQPAWTARQLGDDLVDAITPNALAGRMLTRRAGVGIVVAPTGRSPVTLRKGDGPVTISGPMGECVLYLYGRKDHAEVELAGPPDAVAQVRAAPFGL